MRLAPQRLRPYALLADREHRALGTRSRQGAARTAGRSMTTGAIRVALGALLLGRAGEVLRLTRTPPSGEVHSMTLLLGTRYAAQGALDLVIPHDRRLDAAVESLHAASMLPLARHGRPHARLALLSAAVATGLATADLAAHHRAQLSAGRLANRNQEGDTP